VFDFHNGGGGAGVACCSRGFCVGLRRGGVCLVARIFWGWVVCFWWSRVGLVWFGFGFAVRGVVFAGGLVFSRWVVSSLGAFLWSALLVAWRERCSVRSVVFEIY